MGEVRVDAARIAIPGYTIGERIGAGGFGEVLRARHDAMLELRIARLAVAANEHGARERLASVADDLRAKNLGGYAALADREAARH
jgi:serine/threonine protein kinase